MGTETHLHLRTGETSFIARVPSAEHYRSGQPIVVEVDCDQVRLFDASTEHVLG